MIDLNQEINFNEVILSEEYEDVKNFLKVDIFNNIEGRNDLVTVNFSDEDIYEITKGNLLTYLILAIPFNAYQEEFDPEFLVDASNVNEYNSYFDNIIEYFVEKGDIHKHISRIIDEFALFSGKINVKYGSTVSLKTFCDLAERNPRFNELLNYKIDENANIGFDEMIKDINDKMDEMLDIIRTDEDNNVRDYLLAGAGINENQLKQVILCIGPKPDLFENIIPYPINTSFVRGLNVRDFIINSIGGRKSLITSHFKVRDAGYLTRKLGILNMDLTVSDEDDCGTLHPIEVTIENKGFLKRLKDRWFLNENGMLELITLDREDLIGQTILLRTPITCGCTDGVCKTCYGELYRINQEMNVGVISVLLLTNPLTQRLLSSKHLLQAVASKIDWGKTFDDNFNVNRNLVLLKDTNTKLYIEKDNVDTDEETDNMILRTFEIIDINDGRRKKITVPIDLILAESIKDNLEMNEDKEDNNYYCINLKDFDENEPIFQYVMENNGLSAPLIAIKDLIEKNDYIKSHDITESTNYFMELIDTASLNINYIHIELILRQMFVLKKGLDRESFLEEEFPEYNLYRITDGILHSDSLSKGLLFEQIYKQLTTNYFGTYDKVNPSIFDDFIK